MALSWTLPLDRTHNGIPLANGTQGLMAWGTDALHLTISRAGFWDHRGGNPFRNKTTYKEVASLLQADDEDGLMGVFGRNTSSGDPARPHQLGGGQLVLPFPEGYKVVSAELELSQGDIRFLLGNGQETVTLRIAQSRTEELAWITLPDSWETEMMLKPSWDWVSDALLSVNC